MSKEKPDKFDLLAWMSPTSNDFLGSGMNMREWMLANDIQRFTQSWSQQDRKERKRRLHFITEMVHEQQRIHEAHGTFLEGTWYVQSGAFMESAIEAVIEGDKKQLKDAAEWYSVEGFTRNFGGPNAEESGRHWGEIYAKFTKLCQDAHDSWPTGEEPIQA